MSGREAFGPNLRRLRLKRGILLEEITDKTKVSLALWNAMERNDFSRWPTGLYARAFVREYAIAIGEDADTTVDEFCRWFAQGDRRAEPTMRASAEILQHPNVAWKDQAPATEGERRGAGAKPPTSDRPASGPLTAFAQMFVRLTRLPR
jgi:transcriptional regulator with XRE-family HTH domain